MLTALLTVLSLAVANGCYWNAQCPYQLHSSKTPYQSIRGDIRDFPTPENCEAVSLWSLNRHGNRNPSNSVTAGMRTISLLKDEVIAAYEAGSGEMCAQDIEDLKNWSWNATIETAPSFLTGTGYEELYDMATRIGEKYPNLLQGDLEDYYFRPTNEQRTITSGVAYVHGLRSLTNLDLHARLDGALQRDDVIRPYENCDRYQQEVRGGQVLADKLEEYFNTPEYLAIQANVQRRLGISTPLSIENIYSFFEMCRFYRSWTPTLQCPWCSVFTNYDLEWLEYYDDVRHYYRNGHGSWVNVNLGRTALKDLFEEFLAVTQGSGKKITAYFTHDTMIEMVVSAMGLFQDLSPLESSYKNPNRLWRTSYIGAFSANIVGVLNRCNVSGVDSYRVQLFLNEKVTALCPVEGCTWEEFLDLFEIHTVSNLDFCSMDYETDGSGDDPSNSAGVLRPFWSL